MVKRSNGMVKHFILLFFIIFSAYLASNIMLRYSGYCFKQGRYLSAQEYFDIVAAHIINNPSLRNYYGVEELGQRPMYVVDENGGKVISYFYKDIIDIPFRYSDVAEFHTLNPDAFEFVRTFHGGEGGFYGPQFWDKVNGRLSLLVRVFYICDFNEANKNEPVYKIEYFGLSSCGGVWSARRIEEYNIVGITLF